MTQVEKRYAIAVACGWRYKNSHAMWLAPNGQPGFTDHPDYFNDLNACHEMEEILDGRQWDDYRLYKIPFVTGHTRSRRKDLPWQGDPLHATAAQRAEAFGLTLKLWTPEPSLQTS